MHHFTGLGGTIVYCAKQGLVEGAKLYGDLMPDYYYEHASGNMVKLPAIIRGLGLRFVKTQATTYCRVGECIDSKAGFALVVITGLSMTKSLVMGTFVVILFRIP